ncbi:Modular serine protease [Eumeta japonica]|uniref:Modular serine protease n=1 Tax=Eumeta variegata TaxID=151549 RepID=A0A4C1V3Y5_EUMVA|nr:Modular serine protease [Eumeta japonica]
MVLVSLCSKSVMASATASTGAMRPSPRANKRGRSGRSKPNKCVLPPYPAHGSYIVANHTNAKPGDVFDFVLVEYTCDEGYKIVAKGSTFCYNGYWSDEPPKCEELCRLDPHPSVEYHCRVSSSFTGTRPCKRHEPSGTEVVPKCRTQNYYLNQVLPAMRCKNGQWNYVATCLPDCGKIVPSGTTLEAERRHTEKVKVPWHVGIYTKKRDPYTHVCGGSIITNSHVLSVAHHFRHEQNGTRPASDYAVAGGKLYREWNDPRDENAQKREVEKIKVHTSYSGTQGGFENDIAIIFLSTPFIYNLYIRPVCLDFDMEFAKKQLISGNLGSVAGWGRTRAGVNDTLELKLVEVSYRDINTCLAEAKPYLRNFFTMDKICLGNSTELSREPRNSTWSSSPMDSRNPKKVECSGGLSGRNRVSDGGVKGVFCKGDGGNGLSFPETDRGEKRHYLRGLVSVSVLPIIDDCDSKALLLFTDLSTKGDFIKENIALQEHLRQVIPQTACKLPPYPEHGSYTIVNNRNFMPGDFIDSFYLQYQCDVGYALVGGAELFCINGFQHKEIPKCKKMCSLNPHPSVEYLCHEPQSCGRTRECGLYEPEGTTATPRCRTPNYDTSQYLRDMKCSNGTWNYIATCFAVCGTVIPQGGGLVVGGRVSEKGEVPWHVGIYDKQVTPYKQICGGSIVAPTLVATEPTTGESEKLTSQKKCALDRSANERPKATAHCFWDNIEEKLHPGSRYAVAAGKVYRAWTDSRDDGVQKSDVVKIEIPVTFRGMRTNFQDDIAVIVLASGLVYDEHIRPVCVDFDIFKEKRQLVAGALGKVAGWGLIDEEVNVTQTLQVANLPYIDIKQCLDEAPPVFREYITSDKICAGYVNGTGLCAADSGGGLAFSEVYGGERRYYLRGIVSPAPENEKACNVYAVTTSTQIQSHELFLKMYYIGS